MNNTEISNEEIIAALEKESIMTLATCSGNRVTIRPMSHINRGLTVYFQTGRDSLKVKQIRDNPYVALCVGTYEIEGKASLLGHPFDSGNELFKKKYKEKHPGSYDTYSAYEDEIVVEVNIHRVRQWRYVEGIPCLAEKSYDMEEML